MIRKGGGRATGTYRGGWKPEWVSKRSGWPRSIMPFAAHGFGNGAGPNAKPVGLLEFLIRTYCPRAGLVLDATMGTGSTGIAAMRCGRKFIGIELDRSRFRSAATKIVREKSAVTAP